MSKGKPYTEFPVLKQVDKLYRQGYRIELRSDDYFYFTVPGGGEHSSGGEGWLCRGETIQELLENLIFTIC